MWVPELDVLSEAQILAKAEEKERQFQETIAPRFVESFVDALELHAELDGGGTMLLPMDPTLVSDYAPGKLLEVTLRLSDPLPETLLRKQIRGLLLIVRRPNVELTPAEKVLFKTSQPPILPPHSKVVVDSGKLSYHTGHYAGPIVNSGRIRNDLGAGDDVFLVTPLSTAELRKPRVEDQLHARELLAHLNEHIERYHRVIWLGMDPGRRFMLLDGFLAPNSGGRSVASVVENRLIGIVGNSLVMPVARGIHLDPTWVDAGTDALLAHYQPTTPIPPRRISLPTRGVFAEAVMGSCNSCEKIDDTRAWRWDVATTDEPTAIGPATPAYGDRSLPDLRATPAPSLVQLPAIPDAPAPAALQALAQVLGRPDLFRDITGLAGTQQAAGQAYLGALKLAGSMADQAGVTQRQRETASRAERVLDLLREAEQRKELDPESIRKARGKVFDALSGASSEPAKPPLTQEPVVSGLIGRAGRGGEVSLQRPDGENVAVKLGEPALDQSALDADSRTRGAFETPGDRLEQVWDRLTKLLISSDRHAKMGTRSQAPSATGALAPPIYWELLRWVYDSTLGMWTTLRILGELEKTGSASPDLRGVWVWEDVEKLEAWFSPQIKSNPSGQDQEKDGWDEFRKVADKFSKTANALATSWGFVLIHRSLILRSPDQVVAPELEGYWIGLVVHEVAHRLNSSEVTALLNWLPLDLPEHPGAEDAYREFLKEIPSRHSAWRAREDYCRRSSKVDWERLWFGVVASVRGVLKHYPGSAYYSALEEQERLGPQIARWLRVIASSKLQFVGSLDDIDSRLRFEYAADFAANNGYPLSGEGSGIQLDPPESNEE